MADVQLEHGHIRLANRLAEAMLDAEFSGMQFKILHALVRLTYGWRRRTVTISHAELAGYMHATPSGTFRTALRELIAEGVVIQAEQGGGHKKSTLAIEKDFTKWGRFEVGSNRLSRIYDERPDSNDDALFQADLFRVPANTPAQKQAGSVPESGQADRPEVGTGTGPKSQPAQEVAGRKDRKGQESHNSNNGEAPLAVEIPEELREVVARFLNDRDDGARTGWLHRLNAWMERPPRFTAAEIRDALEEVMVGARDRWHEPRRVLAFVQRVRDDATRRSERRTQSIVTDTAAGMKSVADPADDAWERVLAMMPAWHAREITAAVHKKIPFPTRRALSQIGGFAVIASTPADKRTWLRKDFIRHYRAAAAPHTPTGAPA